MKIMQKKKLVILSAFYEPYMSGAEQMVKEIVERLGDKYKITLITARFDKTLPKIKKYPTFTLVRVGIGHKRFDKLLYPMLAALKTRSIKPDIVHAIMESYAGGALVLIKYLRSKAKRILTLQSGDLDDPMKQGRIFIRLFWRKIHRSPHRVTAISSFLAKRAENLGVSKDNIIITPNGVDLSRIPKTLEKIPNRVIFVGRLSWEKGVDYLLKAWPMVLEEVADAKLVLVGEIDRRGINIETKIKKLVKEFNISHSIEFKGMLPHDQALKEIKKSHVFICPSLAEGLGIVFIEAQACGVPPIGTRVGGIPDVIQNNENGLLIAPKDSVAVAKAITFLLKDKDMANRLSLKGLESVKRFDWKIIIEQIDNLYREI